MPKKECKYPDCVNYTKTATIYCCLACSCDHTDYLRLGLDKKEADHVPNRR